jgi:hypothetical protein
VPRRSDWVRPCAGIVFAEFNSDFVVEGEDVEHHGVVQGLKVRQGADEVLQLEGLVVDIQRRQGADAIGDLIDHAK